MTRNNRSFRRKSERGGTDSGGISPAVGPAMVTVTLGLCLTLPLFGGLAAQEFSYGVSYGRRSFEEFPEADGLNALSFVVASHAEREEDGKMSGWAMQLEAARHWQEDVSGWLGTLLLGYEFGTDQKWWLFFGLGGGNNSLNISVDEGDDIRGSSWFYALGGTVGVSISDRAAVFAGLIQDFDNTVAYDIEETEVEVDISGSRFLVGVAWHGKS